jgi:hypothetical protein
MIFTNLIVGNVRKLPCKFEMFGLCRSWKEDFKVFIPQLQMHVKKKKKNNNNNPFPYCDPTLTPGTMILTNLILDYIGKFPCKSVLFWTNGPSTHCLVRGSQLS